jgi:RNA methyltransferase, TrmH family
VNEALVQRFRRQRGDPGLAVLEGFHPLKHALRFGAEIVEVVAVDPGELERLAADLAPDLAGSLDGRVVPVDEETLAGLAPQAPHTGVVSVARRPAVDVAAALADPRPAPVVLLEDPRRMNNIGVCVRVAAAAGAAAVLTTGRIDPWHPDSLRAAAGLHFALPVARIDSLPESDRPLVAVDPEGDDIRAAEPSPRAVLAFGTERHGLSPELLDRASARLGIPMRPGVSSLNLATSVAAVLFCGRFA